ncbi:Hypothetical predicted protein [Mytilus galloprovincialis]|uniref:B box-type domain-containing protein n=1 Tax=Mytilus galloprovincialis TaxID=29158 RepID=A0A8B6D4E1_MYTGA|nr:Hypothetical predicted protein [Mytilus galloprovincialis]
MKCDEHNQQVILYCPGHLILCCDKCISTVSNKSRNIKTGENNYISIQKSIKEIRKELNKHLDHLEKNLFQELDTIWNHEKSKATDSSLKIDKKRTNLQEMKEDLQRSKQKLLNYNHSYICIGLNRKYINVNDMWMFNDDRANDVDIKMKQNNEIEKILSKIKSLESLGEIIVDQSEINLKIETNKHKEAQVESNINNMTMNISTKIPIKMKKLITDMICLVEGRVIAVEQHGLNDDEIRIIDLQGNTQHAIQVQSKSLLFYHVYCIDRVIFSDWRGKAVYCYGKSDKQIWRYTQDLEGPRGLCTDTYGNIIVADNDADKTIVTSKDGQESKVLLSETNGLKNQMCIFFKHDKSSGFICDYNSTYLAKFDLFYG